MFPMTVALGKLFDSKGDNVGCSFMRGRMSNCVAIGRCPPLTTEALVLRVKRLSHAWSADFLHCSSLMQFLGLAQLTAGDASSSRTMYLGGLN